MRRRLDEDPGVMASGVQVGMSHEALGRRLEVVVHQREQAETGAEHERTFQSFEHRDNTEATGSTDHRRIGVVRCRAHGVKQLRFKSGIPKWYPG